MENKLTNNSDKIKSRAYMGAYLEKRDLLAIFHVMKYEAKCGTCLHKFDCRETTLSNAANHFKIFLIKFEICFS